MTDPGACAGGYALGIDLGGSSAKSVAVTPEGVVLARRQADFDPESPMDWARRIRSLVEEVRGDLGGEARAIGLAAPGLAARDGRSIAFMPGRLHGLEGLDWTTYLGTDFVIPVLNDAHAALLGEVWVGAARGHRNAVLFTLGTGVGGAAMVDGQLLRGEIGRAGHLGHMSLDPHGAPDICGAPGSVELVVGNCTVRERSGDRFATTHDLVRAYEAGDPVAAEVWLESVRGLAAAVASAINVLDPAVVIIGGGIARSGKSLFEPLERFLERMEWRPGGHRARILPAELGEHAGALGAASNALQTAMGGGERGGGF